jgi:hypothetical protein
MTDSVAPRSSQVEKSLRVLNKLLRSHPDTPAATLESIFLDPSISADFHDESGVTGSYELQEVYKRVECVDRKDLSAIMDILKQRNKIMDRPCFNTRNRAWFGYKLGQMCIKLKERYRNSQTKHEWKVEGCHIAHLLMPLKFKTPAPTSALYARMKFASICTEFPMLPYLKVGCNDLCHMCRVDDSTSKPVIVSEIERLQAVNLFRMDPTKIDLTRALGDFVALCLVTAASPPPQKKKRAARVSSSPTRESLVANKKRCVAQSQTKQTKGDNS